MPPKKKSNEVKIKIKLFKAPREKISKLEFSWKIVNPALLKDDIEWKIESHKLSFKLLSKFKLKSMKKIIVPRIWKKSDEITTFKTNPLTESSLSSPKPCPIWTLLVKPKDWPAAIRKNAAPVIKPIPPKIIRKAIIIWPINVQLEAVSTTISPVTVVAEVAVKSASTNDIFSKWEKGRYNNTAPIKIIAKKPYTTISGDDAPLWEVFLLSLFMYWGSRFLSLGLIEEDLFSIINNYIVFLNKNGIWLW